ncbi:copper chaperone PCu(A)C [Rhodobacterales bacterium HKCCE2091]|nr:copper chaperone PCu(A)C [Rhodobacterales bacterium HKCCE2091]
MTLKLTAAAALFALVPAIASAEMIVGDPYARSAGAMAQSGAAFMTIENRSDTDDRVTGVTSDAAVQVELHTHLEQDGVMRMVHVEEGFPIAAGETLVLERGGHHVMFLGLTEPFEQGGEVEITLSFEHADPVTVTIPVDNDRQPERGSGAGMTMGSGHGHGG